MHNMIVKARRGGYMPVQRELDKANEDAQHEGAGGVHSVSIFGHTAGDDEIGNNDVADTLANRVATISHNILDAVHCRRLCDDLIAHITN
jgi:hypothetical protein